MDSHSALRSVPDALEVLQQFSADVAEQGVAEPRVRRRPAFVEQFAAVVRASPCATNVTADYADCRYYLDRAVPAAGGKAGDVLSPKVDTLAGVKQCLTATNLAELAAGTHFLPAGTVVQVFALYTRQGIKQYLFNQPPPAGVVVQITGAAAGGGKYTGSVLAGASAAVASGNVSMPEGLGSSAAALIVNVEEDGESGHRLAIPSYAVGQLVGYSAGVATVMIRGAIGATAGAAALGDGTGGSVSADTTSWSRVSSGLPVSVWAQTRTVWDSTDGTLYAYLRNFLFDARGVLVSISGENQVVVDVPTACQ